MLVSGTLNKVINYNILCSTQSRQTFSALPGDLCSFGAFKSKVHYSFCSVPPVFAISILFLTVCLLVLLLFCCCSSRSSEVQNAKPCVKFESHTFISQLSFNLSNLHVPWPFLILFWYLSCFSAYSVPVNLEIGRIVLLFCPEVKCCWCYSFCSPKMDRFMFILMQR